MTVFISFFSTNGRYPGLARQLIQSLEKHKLPNDIVQINNISSWGEGCALKASFILEKLLQHRKPVIWLDIDTTVWKYPGLLFGEEDFAIYNWYADLNHHLEGMIEYNPDATNLFCSGGVQKWGYTAPAIELLIRWIRAIHESDKSKGDDPVLDYVFNKFQPPVKPLWLPKTYNRMDKHTWHWQSVPLDQVVINHDYTAGQHGLADC